MSCYFSNLLTDLNVTFVFVQAGLCELQSVSLICQIHAVNDRLQCLQVPVSAITMQCFC